MDETGLIERYFRDLGAVRGDVSVGIGDDAAVLAVPGGVELVATTDTLVEGTHFLPGSAARSIGHRALAVNLSDCAAMGATPAWALLSLTLPLIDESWLSGFALGFGALARAHDVALVGGNLCRGPLSVTVQLTGFVAPGCAVRRSGAQPGDLLCLTGTVGDAAAGLAVRRGELAAIDQQWLCQRFEYPEPRVGLGAQLHGVASACIDISDGVYADLGRLAAASECSARIELEQLPLSAHLTRAIGVLAWQYALQGGEDYELGIAVPPTHWPALQALAARHGTQVTCVGQVVAGDGIELRQEGNQVQFQPEGFDHFSRNQ
jgi:thiamine-monophosphate kinase